MPLLERQNFVSAFEQMCSWGNFAQGKFLREDEQVWWERDGWDHPMIARIAQMRNPTDAGYLSTLTNPNRLIIDRSSSRLELPKSQNDRLITLNLIRLWAEGTGIKIQENILEGMS